MQVGPNTRLGRFTVCGAILTCFAVAGVAQAAQGQRLLETGSSLLYPLFNIWVPAYTKTHPNVQITTQSTGSGTGMSQAVSGLAQIGASDAYLSNALMKQHPNMLNIPLAISSQMVNYNIPGMNGEHLKLSGPVIADIYLGKITHWNDPQIKKLNSGANLPDKEIVPIHRTDGSGDTFIFSQYLADSSPEWAKAMSYGTTLSWPSISGALGAEGNQGMVNSLHQTPYSIAYIGISFKNVIDSEKMGEAMLGNRAGNFVLPSDETVEAAASGMVSQTPEDERISLIFAPGEKSYPIINYEYAIVNSQQHNQETAQELKNFLNWAIAKDGGNAQAFMNKVNFVALPPNVRKLSESQISAIKG